MQIQPLYLPVGGLLSGRLFKIPEYQRAYSWQTKQRVDLFKDIEKVFNSDADSTHFMATIVGLRRKKKRIASDEFQEIEVVDGQQRLTTLTILLKALSKQLKTKDVRRAQEIDSLLVKGDDLALLVTNHDINHIFADYLRDGAVPNDKVPYTSADQNIIDAIAECEKFVTNWNEQRGRQPIDLYSIIKNRLSAIFFEIEDEGVVYTVFEVLNSRGLDVTWFDRLKSLLMAVVFDSPGKSAKLDTVAELHGLWTEIYRVIGLRWQSLNKETVRFAGTLHSLTIPARPLSEEDAVASLVSACKGIPRGVIDCSKWVLKVTQTESRLLGNHRVTAATRIAQARLLAVAILLRDFPEIDEKRLLREWENVTFRIYGLGRFDARQKVGDYIRLAWKITNDGLKPEKITEEIQKLGSEEEFAIRSVVKKLNNKDCYKDWSEELRYFLYRYEEHLAQRAGQKINESMWTRIWQVDPSKSIEHIFPQSKGSDSPSTSGIYVHRLGNLVMLPPGVNSKLQDLLPTQKAATYATQGLLQAIEVSKLISKGKWNRSAVQKREKRLIRWATQEWSAH
jgi:Protein of unknown function DUF262/Protein of unknown function (DUF1524)